MQLRYGSLLSEHDGFIWSASKDPVWEDGRLVSYRVSWDVQFIWTGDDYRQVAQKVNLADKLLSIQYRDVVFLGNSGEVVRALANAGSLTGVQVLRISLPPNVGAEGVNRATMAVTFQAEYPTSGTLQIIHYAETVGFSGGAPVRDVALDINGGPPLLQTVHARTPHTAFQRGSAVGLSTWPPPEPPLWPAALWGPPDVQYDSPQRRGYGVSHYTTRWSYSFLSVVPLAGRPHVPPLR